MANKAKKDFLEVKKDVEDEMINKILNYLRTGSMECLVNNKPGSYMTAYTSTQTFADLGDEQSEKLFTYFVFHDVLNSKISPAKVALIYVI